MARLRVPRPAFEVVVDLDVAPGEVVCLLGPNGAGKSTALAAVAGLVDAPGSHVVLDGRPLDDGERPVPARERGVGLVFQDHRLFPHLDAVENVAFGLRARGVRRAEARRLALVELDRLGVADLAARRPGALSGGQAQRVAVARALAARPSALLLDEPLAALDAESRLATRAALTDVLRGSGRPVLLVSHDPADAVALADRVLVLERGHVVQEGASAAVLADPHTPYAASLTGATLWLPERTVLATEGDGVVGVLPGGVRIGARRRATDGPARVVVPAAAARLLQRADVAGTPGPPHATPDGAPEARPGPAPLLADVVRLEPRTTRLAVTVRLRQGGHELTAEIGWADEAATHLRPGDAVEVVLDPDRVVVR